MKLVKYLISVIFIILGFMGSNSIVIQNLDVISETEYYYAEYVDTDIIADNWKPEYGIRGKFLLDKKGDDRHQKYIFYYQGDGKTYLEKSGKREGIYKNIDGSSVEIKYVNANSVRKTKCFEEVEVYVLGDAKSLRKLESEMDGNKILAPLENRGYQSYILLIWILVAGFFLLLTLCDYYFVKKSEFQKVVTGYPVPLLFLQNVLLDAGVLAGISFVVYWIFHGFLSMTLFVYLRETLLVYVGVILIVSILYAFLLKLDYRSITSRGFGAGFIKAACYFLKFTSITFTVVLLIVGFYQVKQYLPLKEKKDFYSHLKNYCYINDKYILEDGMDIQESYDQLYCKFLNKCKIAYMSGVSDIKDIQVYQINKYCISMIRDAIPELKDYKFENKIYYIYPDWKISENEIKEYGENCSNLDYLDAKNMEVEYLPYHHKIGAFYEIGIDYIDNEKVEDEVFLLDTRDHVEAFDFDVHIDPDTEIAYPEKYRELLIPQFALFEMNDQIAEEMVDEVDGLASVSYRNIYDSYKEYVSSFEIRLKLIFSICLLMFLINIIVNTICLNIEFEMDGMECAVAKINGMPMLYRYYGIFLSNIVSMVLSLFAVYEICMRLFREFNLPYVLIIVAIIAVVDIILIAFNISRRESIQVQKILKGGCL